MQRSVDQTCPTAQDCQDIDQGVHSLVLLTVFFLYLSLTLHWVWSFFAIEEEAVWGYHHTQPMPTPSPSLIAWDFCPHCSGHTSWFWENFQRIAPYPGSWHSSWKCKNIEQKEGDPDRWSIFRPHMGSGGHQDPVMARYKPPPGRRWSDQQDPSSQAQA